MTLDKIIAIHIASLKRIGKTKIKGVGEFTIFKDTVNAGGLNDWKKAWIEYIASHPVEKQKEFAERIVNGERLINITMPVTIGFGGRE